MVSLTDTKKAVINITREEAQEIMKTEAIERARDHPNSSGYEVDATSICTDQYGGFLVTLYFDEKDS
jgi:hypothetical protein